MKNAKCNSMTCTSWLMAKFLGAYLLIAGLNMLLSYQVSVDYMIAAAGKPSLAVLHPVTDFLTIIVAYIWPILQPFLGLALLTNFKKCLAIMALYGFMLLFLLGHMMAGDMTGGTFVLIFVLFLSCMKAFTSMGGSCDAK